MKSLSTLILMILFSWQALAGPHLCPVKPLEDDGCSYDHAGDFEFITKLATSPYNSRWNSACSSHDTCYQTIGKTRKQCDETFKSNMQSACSIDPLCQTEAEIIYSAVRDSGGQYYRDAMGGSTDEIESLKDNIKVQACVSTSKYTGRVSTTALSYLKESFNDKVARYPTTEEEFTLLDEFPVSTSDSVYSNWQTTIDNKINQDYIGTTGPQAIYNLDANNTPFGIVSITVNGSYSKNTSSFLWHMVHTEYTTSSFTKSTPPAGGMMYIDGYLRVQDSNQKYDYIVIDESFLVNSCTTTICEIEP